MTMTDPTSTMKQFRCQPANAISLTTLLRKYAGVPRDVAIADGLPYVWKWLHTEHTSPKPHVWVDRSCENILTPDQINQLIKILADVKCVEEITINAHQYKSGQNNQIYRQAVDSKAIAILLKRNRHLRTLSITGRMRFHDQDDLEIFTRSIRDHPSLETLELHSVSVGNRSSIRVGDEQQHNDEEESTTDPTRINLDALFSALATLPNLKHLEIVGDGPFAENASFLGDQQSAPVIASLLGEKNKHHDDEHPHQNSIHHPTSVEISHNPKLVYLGLRNMGLTDLHMQAIANALRNCEHQCLETLDVRCNRGISCQGQEAVLNVLMEGENYHLRRIEMDLYKRSPKSIRIFRHLHFYLRLNRANRRLFLHNKATSTTFQQRVEALIACRYDLDVLSYFVRQDPSILEAATRAGDLKR